MEGSIQTHSLKVGVDPGRYHMGTPAVEPGGPRMSSGDKIYIYIKVNRELPHCLLIPSGNPGGRAHQTAAS